MSKAILNYTTNISVNKTSSEMQALLARAGAQSIRMDFEGGEPSILYFQISNIPYKLAPHYQGVLRALKKAPPKYRTQEQARKVAWRILKNWLEVQLAAIESQIVEVEEIFMPYVVSDSGETLYEAAKRFGISEFRALPPSVKEVGK